jgi:hypothetical protein
MTKIVKVLLLALILAVMLPMSTAQADCVPDWSQMSDEEIVFAINNAENEPRYLAGESGELPPAPVGYAYAEDYTLVPLSV